MFTIAAFGNEPIADAHRDVIARLCGALGDHCVLRSVPDGEFSAHVNRSHSGTKYTFWHQSDESGLLCNINPNAGNLTKLYFSKIKGYASMCDTDKQLARATLAALYGLEGSEKSKCKFIVTYDPTFKGTYLPLMIGLNLGIKVFNFADKNDLAAMVKLIKMLRGKS